MIFAGEILQAKLAHKLIGQVWENSDKNSSHTQKFVFCYTYAYAGLLSRNMKIRGLLEHVYADLLKYSSLLLRFSSDFLVS